MRGWGGWVDKKIVFMDIATVLYFEMILIALPKGGLSIISCLLGGIHSYSGSKKNIKKKHI